jgi:plasmid stability protein
MAALTIRNLDESLKSAMRIRAAQNGVSMEEEARRILREALSPTPSTPLGQRLLKRFHEVASEDFTEPQRHLPRAAPDWPSSSARLEQNTAD